MMSFWDIFAAAAMTGGTLFAFPYVGPILRAHWTNARIEQAELEQKHTAATAAIPRDQARAEEIKELIHRQTIAEQEKRTIKAEAERDMLASAVDSARASGALADAGLRQLQLPPTAKASTPVTEPTGDVEVIEPRFHPGRRAAR